MQQRAERTATRPIPPEDHSHPQTPSAGRASVVVESRAGKTQSAECPRPSCLLKGAPSYYLDSSPHAYIRKTSIGAGITNPSMLAHPLLRMLHLRQSWVS